MILFPFTPNWVSPLRDTRQFQTEILTSRQGDEQRAALRSTPRRTIEFEFMMENEERARELDVHLFRAQADEMVLPDFVGGVRSTGAMPVSARSIAVATVPAWITPGVALALTAGRQMRLMTVESVGAGSVVFTGPSDVLWYEGTKLCPLLPGRVASSVGLRRHTSRLGSGTLSFAVRPGSALADDGVPGLRHDGREILTLRPNWSQAPDITFAHETEAVDFGRGRTVVYAPIPFTTRTAQSVFMSATAGEARGIAAFHARMKGQRGEFWQSSWTDDMALDLPAAAGSMSLSAKSLNVRDAFASGTTHRAIALVLGDGTFLSLTVAAVAAAGSKSTITLAAPLPRRINSGEVVMASWMFNSRFASDELVLEHVTDEVARFTLTTSSLPVTLPESLS